MLSKFKCSSGECGRTFLLSGRLTTEKKPLDFAFVRVVVEKACCPFCEGLEFEEVVS